MKKMAKAKSEMLKELSSEMSNESYSPMKDMLGKKGMKKVSVMSDSPEGLKKGLSMAEKLMQLKSKQNGEEEDMGESEEEESSPEMIAKDEISEMSDEEKLAMFELLKKELGKA
jgi:hypothetical protein